MFRYYWTEKLCNDGLRFEEEQMYSVWLQGKQFYEVYVVGLFSKSPLIISLKQRFKISGA